MIKLSDRNCLTVKEVKKVKNVLNNHFGNKESEINLLDNLKLLNGLNEDFKVKKIYSKKANPTIDMKVEKEEMTNNDILPEGTERSNFHFQTIKLMKPFPCSLCDLAFNRRLFLTKHMQLV